MASSRFFATGDSSDESDKSASGSDEEVDVMSTQLGGAGQVKLVYSSSESEEEKRTIRSAKDKAFDHILATTKALRNHLKIQDYASVTKDWESLGKQMEKARAVVAKEGVPAFYLTSLAQLNQSLNDTFANKDEVKKMSSSQSKALTALRSKVKKQLATQPLQGQIEAHLKKNPLPAGGLGPASDDESKKSKKKKDDSESESDEEEEKPKPKAKKPAAAKKKAESSSSSSSESDDDTKKKKPLPKKPVAGAAAAKKKDDSSSSSSSSDSSSDSDSSASEDSDESTDSESSMSSGEDSDAADAGNAWFTREFWLKKEFKKGYKGPAPKAPKADGDDDDESGDEDASGEEDEDDEQKEELAEKRRQQHAARAAKKLKAQENFDKLKQTLLATSAEDEKKAEAEELKPEQVLKRLKDLLALRGKRGTDVAQLIVELKSLRAKSLKVASAPALLKLNVTLMASLFDLQLNKSVKNKGGNKDVSIDSAVAAAGAPAGSSAVVSDEFMDIKSWKEACEVLGILLNQLAADSTIALSEDEKQDEKFLDEDLTKRGALLQGIPEEDEQKQKTAAENVLSPRAAAVAAQAEEKRLAELAANPNETQYVIGSLLGFIQSLCREYTKSLLHIDPHSLDYIERLKHEQTLVDLVARVQEYYSRMSAQATPATVQGKRQMEAKVVLLRLELLYYRYHADLDVLKASVEASNAESANEKKTSAAAVRAADVKTVVPQLAQFLYKYADQKGRIRGLLMHVFWLALHSRYVESRELLLMSHLHENVHDLGMKTRILYNRALALLGLCAFKYGEFKHCLDALAELHQSNKIKELLAQGVSMNRWQERDIEEEEMHRRRQYPYHQHLNLDSLEAVHLICAMLLEVPNLALHGTANKRRILSRLFRRMWEHHLRQAFSGPPENTRDLIMAATKALTKGDWEACAASVKKLRLWDSLKSNSGGEAVKAHIQALLLQRIKEEALRTYLISYSQHFLHIKHDHLAGMFSLDMATVQKIASSLMVNEQLQASWDEPNHLLVIEQTPSNKLQKSAVAFTDKALVFLDQNERLLDSRPQDRERRERAERADGASSGAGSGEGQGSGRGALAGRFRGGRGGGGRGRGRGGRGGRGGGGRGGGQN